MKQQKLLLLSLLGTLAVITGCTGQMSYSKTDTATQAKECKLLNDQLTKIDTFIEKVQAMPSVHAEELGYTLPQTDITQSSNKKRMLRDAQEKKSALHREEQKMGCKPQAKS